MFSAYKLNKQGDNIQPWRISFPIRNQSLIPCPVLTVASWPAYRFLKRQVRCSGIPILSEFSTVCGNPHSQRLWIVNQAEIDVFLELSFFFDDSADIGNLISDSSAFYKTSLNIWNFMVFILLKRGLENFEYFFAPSFPDVNVIIRHIVKIHSAAVLFSTIVHEVSDVQAGFRKARGTRDQIANILWIIEKAREFKKTSMSALWTMPKPLTVRITINCGKFWKRWEYQTTWPASWETCMQIRKQEFKQDMEKQSGSK